MKPRTTAEPRNSTLEKLAALPELLFGDKAYKNPHFTTHFPPAQRPAARKIKSLAGNTELEQRRGFGGFLSTPETGAAASPFSTSHPSAGVLLVGTCSAICIGAAQPLCERAGGDRDAKGRFPDSKIILFFAHF